MSDQLRSIVQELNKEPFNRNLNLISFDSLSDQQLLQILNDVFAEIDAKQHVDIREEEPDMTAIRMLGFLRMLKYKPPMENMNNFRQGLVEGTKEVIYPLLQWMLTRIPELKNRAYLAKFLLKVDVPPEMLGDPDVADLYQQYEEQIENFKAVHKECSALRNSGFMTSEIRRDISNMEEEKEQLQKRIEKLKRKVESIPKKEVILTMTRNLRLEREKEQKLFKQKQDQRNAIIHAEQKISNLNQQLSDIKQAGLKATPEGLFQRLEEEVQVKTYIVKQKIPKELLIKRKRISNLQKVAMDTNVSPATVTALNDKIQQFNTEINQIIEKRMKVSEGADDKLNMFRQQAAIIGRKKEMAAEKMNEVRQEYAQLEEELKEKQEQLSILDNGGEILRGEDLKRYVNKLRGKSNTYKKKRQELSEIKAENGVLARTEEILQQRSEQTSHALQNMEEMHGLDGYRDAQEDLENVSAAKSVYDEQKGQKLEEISVMVNQMNAMLMQRKAALAPLIKELRPLRENCHAVNIEYEQRKGIYDNAVAGVEASLAKLQQEVKQSQEELIKQETKFHFLNNQKEILNFLLQRAVDELKIYTTATDAAEKRKSLRDQYTQKIQEQERSGKQLRDDQKNVRDNFQRKQLQMKMWQDLKRLYECKHACFERSSREVKSGTLRRDATGAESLVL